MPLSRIISIVILVLFFQIHIARAHQAPTVACEVVQVELLRLSNTGQWDSFLSSLNEFFFDVFTDAAKSRGSGHESQVMTPKPLNVYHSDTEDGRYNLAAFIPVQPNNAITIEWRENDSFFGNLDRSSANTIGNYTLEVETILTNGGSVIRNIPGKRNSGKIPQAKFKYSCLSDIHQQSRDRFAQFFKAAKEVFNEKVDIRHSFEEAEEAPEPIAFFQDRMSSAMTFIYQQFGVDVEVKIQKLAFHKEFVPENLLTRLKSIQSTEDKAQKEAKIREFFDQIQTLELWAQSDFLSILPEIFQKFNIGPVHLQMQHTSTLIPPAENDASDARAVDSHSHLTFDLNGNVLGLVEKAVNDKIREYPFGGSFTKNYVTLRDAFDHLSSLNVMANREGFSTHMTPNPLDLMHLYIFNGGQLRMPTAEFDKSYIVMQTLTGEGAQEDGNAFSQESMLLLFWLSFAEELEIDIVKLMNEYSDKVVDLFKKLPLDVDLAPSN